MIDSTKKTTSINNIFNFTTELLLDIVPPKIDRDFYKDTEENGLILIVSYGGSKVFYLPKNINGKYRRLKIGKFPNMSITEARIKASDLKKQIAMGIDPTSIPTSEPVVEITFKQLFNRYINDYAKYNTKGWQQIIVDTERQAKSLYDITISTISKDDIQKIFNNLTENGIYCANRFVGRLSPVFNKAIEWGLLEKNPTIGIKHHKEKSRDRYLTAEEIPAFFKALDNSNNQLMKDFILISLYTGVRKEKILAMSWNNISFINKTWYIPDDKNGDPHSLPLVDEVMTILIRRKEQQNSIWVFPSPIGSKTGHLQEPKTTWYSLIKKAGLTGLRLHDLRRTMGSWMAISGASQYVISKTLNHKDPKSTAIYARLSLDPVRESMNKATSTINQIKRLCVKCKEIESLRIKLLS